MASWIPQLEGLPGTRADAIVAALAADITAGRLGPGDRLPPQRRLASDLGVSPNTVLRAYAEATRRGYVAGHVGRGTYVRGAVPVAPAPTLTRPDGDGPVDLSTNLPLVGMAAEALAATLADLAAGGPASLAGCLDRADAATGTARAGSAAAWIGTLGARVDPDRLVPVAGAQHGIFATLLAVLRPGDTLLTENLTYAPIVALAEHLGVRVQPLPLDDEGLLPDALEAACRNGSPKALYCTPTVQTPTTATMGEDRRRAVARIAAAHDLVVVEDDVFGFLPARRPAPLAAFAPDHVVHVTSVSKSMAPGLRVGYLHAPDRLLGPLRAAVATSVWMPPPLTAQVVHLWLLDGTADRLARAQRAHATRRQAAAAAALAGQPLRADPHGLHVWLPLPPHWTSRAFTVAAEQAGVLVNPAEAFAVAAPAPAAVRLCLGHETSDERVARGLATLAALLDGPEGRTGQDGAGRAGAGWRPCGRRFGESWREP